MEQLGKQLQLPDMESWYYMTAEQIAAHGGESLMRQHRNSPLSLLESVFPYYQWLPWKCNRVPNGFWDLETNRLAFLEWVAKQLGVTNLEGWYKVTGQQFLAQGGKTLLLRYSSLPNILQEHYPNFPWLLWKFPVVPGEFWTLPQNRKRFFGLAICRT